MPKAGTLNRRVSLRRREQDQDELGKPIDSWVEFASVAANVRMLTGEEVLVAHTDVSIGTASMRIRYRADVTNADRAVIDDATIFDINAALPRITRHGTSPTSFAPRPHRRRPSRPGPKG